MPERRILDEDLNAFAMGVVNGFAKRAVGTDEGSRRVVGVRPAEHILAGFLTPAAGAPGNPATASPKGVEEVSEAVEPEESLWSDLPRDSAYEQSNLGMHWLVPTTAFQQPMDLELEVQLSLFVRRIPSRDEQQRALWSVPRARSREQSNASTRPLEPQATAVPVWTREDITELPVVRIGLENLRRSGRITEPLSEAITKRLSTHTTEGLYPGRRALVIRQADTADEDRYKAWLRSLPAGKWPVAWAPMLDIRLSSVPADPTVMRVTARIINRTAPPPRSTLDFVDPNLYAVRLTARVPALAHRPTIFRELPQSFRYDRSMPAVGLNSHASYRSSGDFVVLQSEAVPIHVSQRLEPRAVEGASPTFESLASNPLPLLQRLLEAMHAYDLNDWTSAVDALQEAGERDEATNARHRFQDEIERFQRGVNLLRDSRYPNVQRAFSLMNRTMANVGRGRFSEWRLFQLVFIVSQIPILAGREHEELAQPGDEDVDVLWFAAGGGKTEAFLGLILWQLFFDRLRGKTIGVAAFVRFPLRLLTFQQLQRLAAALAAAEMLRRQERLGGAHFSMGYFVGRGTTPNDIDDDTHRRYQNSGPDPKVKRLYSCPFCGADTLIRYDPDQRLVEHRCSQAGAGCPFGNERLPVYVVDSDLYRFLPSVVVSTVDKLAQFGQNQRFAQLMGRISCLCRNHGASFLGANRRCAGAERRERDPSVTSCGTNPLQFGPFHDLAPSLLIQDELHLLCEELGTFDGHYETSVAELMRSIGGRPWKIIAATATIENYQDHAWNLYLKRARQFPGPGPKAYESFYYAQNAEKIGRVFVGVLGVGRKHTPAVSRALALLYLELQLAREEADRDLAAACRRYGLSALTSEEFRYILFLYELVLTYVLTRKGSDQVAEAIESRVKRDINEVCPSHGDLLVDTLNGGVSEAEMSTAIQQIRTASPTDVPSARLRGIVATNVIGHGVDVDRFNVMCFAGFPRLVAEYIQASARVGRTFPGISVFVATPQSERDRSIYDRFSKFHEYVDRLVDPSAISRWPEAAMRRTVSGVLAGYLMGVAPYLIGRRLSTVEQVQDAFASGARPLLMDAVVAWIERAYGVEHAPQRFREQLRIAVQNRYSSVVNLPRAQGGRPRNINTHLEAMQSLRDTDDPAIISVSRPDEAAILRRLLRA